MEQCKKWQFYKYEKGETQRDSSSAKFFKGQDINKSLIREFTQNSLDAKQKNKEEVEVHISKITIPFTEIKKYLQGLEKHFKKCDYIKYDFKNNKDISFLILEDFNTKGLEQGREEDFFEKDNITDKYNTKRGGSHGIGKILFYQSSKINTIFAFSNVNNGKQILRGKCILESHNIGEDAYKPDGSLNLSDNEDDINFFKENLFLNRKNEPGFSVAIILPTEEINIEQLKKACSSEFYYPILNKKLIFNIERKKINSKNLSNIEDNPKIKPKINILLECLTSDKYFEENLNCKTNDDLKNRDKIIELLDSKKLVNIKFNIDIYYKKEEKESEKGYLSFLIKKNDENNEQKIKIDFWRNDLLINAVGKQTNKYLIIILIDDEYKVLSQFLRSLEDPGHTKWETKSLDENIKDKYKYIPQTEKIIRDLPKRVIDSIKPNIGGLNKTFFSDYFPSTKAGSNKKGSTSGKKSISPIVSNIPSNFIYKKNKGGFNITINKKIEIEKIPENIKVQVAYGTNSGNPFSKYDPRDFDFKIKENIVIKVFKGKQILRENNTISCEIKNQDFKITFTGFDVNRELIIKIK